MNHLNIGDIKLLAQRAHADKEFMSGLFCELFGSNDERQSANAAWALTHLPDADNACIAEHRDELVRLAMATTSVTVRRLTMVLLERLEWGVDDVRTDLLDFCIERMMSPTETYGVRALAMKLAYRQCRHYKELREELRQSLLFMEPEHLGRGVLHTRKKILAEL